MSHDHQITLILVVLNDNTLSGMSLFLPCDHAHDVI